MVVVADRHFALLYMSPKDAVVQDYDWYTETSLLKVDLPMI